MNWQKRDSGVSMEGVIDGWESREESRTPGMRIDYIWCSVSAPYRLQK